VPIRGEPVKKVATGSIDGLERGLKRPEMRLSESEWEPKRAQISFSTGSVVFGALLAPLQNACAFSHLYPTPLNILVGLVMTSVEPHFTLPAPGFYSRSWISVSEKTSSRQSSA
jgi:hypothetical protein